MAGDVGCPFGKQENSGFGDVLGLAEALQRDFLEDFFGGQVLGHVGFHETGGDAVYGDVPACEFQCE